MPPLVVRRLTAADRPVLAGEVEELWIARFNAAFADDPTPLQLDASIMAAGYDDLVIEDADTDLAKEVATSALVGFCATSPVREDGVVAPHGEIWTIGVRLDRQGAGLGRQLLCWGARRLGSVGVTDISRAVNGRNDRALGLFESEGFIRSRTRERWSRRVEAGSAQGETP